MKMTRNRKRILHALQKGGALSVGQLHKALPEMDLVTIYRNVDLFTKENLVKKLSYKDEAVYEYQETPHHHALCDDCDKVIHFSVKEDSLKKLIKIENFSVDSIDITVKGKCI